MALIIEELREITKDLRYYRAGKLKDEQVDRIVALLSQSEKRQRQVIDIIKTGLKYGKRAARQIASLDLIGNEVICQLLPEEIEDEVVLCPIKKKGITRGECLDYSGDKKNFENCKDCEIGLANKKLVL